MALKTTRKAIDDSYSKKLAVGYCDMQHLLRFTDKTAYTCGTYGWNFDLYVVEGVAITTGYRGMVGKTANYEMLKEYEKKARNICSNWDISYEEQKKQVNELLAEYLSCEF